MPKAVRRRPAASQASQPAPTPPSTSNAESQLPSEASQAPAAAEPSTPAQSQDAIAAPPQTQPSDQSVAPVSKPSQEPVVASTVLQDPPPTPATTQAVPTVDTTSKTPNAANPPPTAAIAADKSASQNAATRTTTNEAVANDESGTRSPKRPREEPAGAVDKSSKPKRPRTSRSTQQAETGGPAPTPTLTNAAAPESDVQPGISTATTTASTAPPQSRLSHLRGSAILTPSPSATPDVIPDPAAEAARSKRKPAARGRKKASDKASGEQGEGSASAKTKKPRATKGKKRQSTGEDGGGDTEASERPRKKRASNATVLPSIERDGEVDPDAADEVELAPKRRGRQKSETPSDAEDQFLDKEHATMGQIAKKHYRRGKISNREKAMRQINWEEVKERNREREREQAMAGSQNQEGGDALDREANGGVVGAAPRMVMVDGVMVIDEETAAVDTNAIADQEAEGLEAVEESDLTTRITTQTWVLQNKRDPELRIRSNRIARWNREDTEKFYRALSLFGTDFGMMEAFFPGVSRKSLKNKYNREDRENPDRVTFALQGKRLDSFEEYLALTNQKEEDFQTTEELNRQLEEERLEQQAAIDKAKAEREEDLRLRALAGVDENGNVVEPGKKKSKKNQSNEEEEVILLGDDDGTMPGDLEFDENGNILN